MVTVRDLTPSEKACFHIMRRMISDGRLAYLIGPGSEAYALLTEATAATAGESVDSFRADLEPLLKPKRVKVVEEEEHAE